jgi:hypothetical protein
VHLCDGRSSGGRLYLTEIYIRLLEKRESDIDTILQITDPNYLSIPFSENKQA